MRGQDHQQSDIFSYLSPEQRVRPDHPLRAIRAKADLALGSMSERFDAMYSKTGRSLHFAGEVVTGTVDPDVVFGAERTIADGRDRLHDVALKWYRLAAGQGSSEGLNGLGTMYYHGLGGLPEDHNEARELWVKASQSGNSAAKDNLSRYRP